jgi:hypothetical protein
MVRAVKRKRPRLGVGIKKCMQTFLNQPVFKRLLRSSKTNKIVTLSLVLTSYDDGILCLGLLNL